MFEHPVNVREVTLLKLDAYLEYCSLQNDDIARIPHHAEGVRVAQEYIAKLHDHIKQLHLVQDEHVDMDIIDNMFSDNISQLTINSIIGYDVRTRSIMNERLVRLLVCIDCSSGLFTKNFQTVIFAIESNCKYAVGYYLNVHEFTNTELFSLLRAACRVQDGSSFTTILSLINTATTYFRNNDKYIIEEIIIHDALEQYISLHESIPMLHTVYLDKLCLKYDSVKLFKHLKMYEPQSYDSPLNILRGAINSSSINIVKFLYSQYGSEIFSHYSIHKNIRSRNISKEILQFLYTETILSTKIDKLITIPSTVQGLEDMCTHKYTNFIHVLLDVYTTTHNIKLQWQPYYKCLSILAKKCDSELLSIFLQYIDTTCQDWQDVIEQLAYDSLEGSHPRLVLSMLIRKHNLRISDYLFTEIEKMQDAELLVRLRTLTHKKEVLEQSIDLTDTIEVNVPEVKKHKH